MNIKWKLLLEQFLFHFSLWVFSVYLSACRVLKSLGVAGFVACNRFFASESVKKFSRNNWCEKWPTSKCKIPCQLDVKGSFYVSPSHFSSYLLCPFLLVHLTPSLPVFSFTLSLFYHIYDIPIVSIGIWIYARFFSVRPLKVTMMMVNIEQLRMYIFQVVQAQHRNTLGTNNSGCDRETQAEEKKLTELNHSIIIIWAENGWAQSLQLLCSSYHWAGLRHSFSDFIFFAFSLRA